VQLIVYLQSLLRWDMRGARYLAVSAMALAADSALFLLLLGGGMTALGASATGYLSGIFVHWAISSRLVFADHAATRGSPERNRQKMLFAGAALIGLAITTGIVGGGTALGLDPRLAKLIAIAVSFQSTYLLRRHVVFGG
jgi:putative flippase GtrA